jgi:hypothetical protein
MSNTDLNMAHGVAKAMIQQHYWQYLSGHREQLITACARELIDKGYPMSIAMKVAIKELANYESALCNAELDIDRSSSSLIVIHDRQNNLRQFFTIQDVLNTASALTIRNIG